MPPEEVPELLLGLVDRSLVQLASEPGRYRMLESVREYGIDRLVGTGDLGVARDLAAGHFVGLMEACDAELRGPGQLSAMRTISAEYDNALASLRHRCDIGDADGAIDLALNLTWYWHMVGRNADAGYWLGEALAVPGGEPTPNRDCARAAYLVEMPSGPVASDDVRELLVRLLAYPELPGPYAALVAHLHDEETRTAILRRLARGNDVWLSGLAHLLLAQFAEIVGELDEVRTGVEAALTCFRQVGDRWGRIGVLPMRAQLQQYDGELDGAMADLREARSLAGDFGALSVGDEVFLQLRWIDLHLRRGDGDLAIAMTGSARAHAGRATSPELGFLVNAWEALLRVRRGDTDRARDLLEGAELGLRGTSAFPAGHTRTLVSSLRAQVCLELGDPAGADEALAAAYAAALTTQDLPIMSLVAVTAAAVTEGQGEHHAAAVLLGAASRLRGTHDRTDPRVRDLTRRGRATLGDGPFAAAYGEGWNLDGEAAAVAVRRAAERSSGRRSAPEHDGCVCT